MTASDFLAKCAVITTILCQLLVSVGGKKTAATVVVIALP